MTIGPRRVRTWLAASVLALSLSACTEKVPFWSPEGGDATIAGGWTVGGAVPDATSCGAVGLTEVDLVFVHDATDVVIGTFTFPCPQGGFDSRPTPAVAAGTYLVHWRFVGRTDAGALSFETSDVTIVAVAGGHIDVPPGDFAPPAP